MKTSVQNAVTIALLCAAVMLCEAGEKLRVGTWKTPQTIQPFFYDQFMDSSDEVKVFPFTNPADQKMALLSSSLDMCGTTLAHAIASASRGEPVVCVAALCNKCSALIVGSGSGITTVQQLQGKKIGYVPGTMHEVLLRESLTRAGLSPTKDVQLMRVDFFDMGTALAKGNIHAFLSGEPFPTMAVQKGYGKLLAYPYYDESIGTINAAMLVHRKTVRKHPEKVHALVTAHIESTEFLNANRDAWLTRAARFGTARKILDDASKNMELAWDMDDAFVEKARALGERMQALGIIRRQPDYDKLIDRTFIKRYRHERSAKQESK
jgi:NitT/TauT family transport system substrate-binding protein